MGLIPENPVVGGNVLRREAIQSPGFLTGSQGWSINQDGSAEFNNVIIRNGQIISGNELFYSSDPGAFGTLITSISPSGVQFNDQYGNRVLPGIVAYQKNSPTSFTAQQYTPFSIENYTATSPAGPWNVATSIGFGNSTLIQLNGPNAPLFFKDSLIVAQDPNAVYGTQESWHPIPGVAFQNGWANAAGRMACSYKLLPHGWIGLAGSLAVPAGVIVGQNIFQITNVGYQPVQPKPVVGRNVTQSNLIEFNYTGTGILRYQSGTQAAGNVIDFAVSLPLDI